MVAVGGWLFLLLSVASFHATDWPSHAVYPYPATANLCGPAGAVVSYGLFLLFGQGAFPILLFSGVGVVLFVAQNRVSDPWMRTVGSLLLAVAFAAAVHDYQPGNDNGLPEGQGGVLGIGAATFLQAHFSTAGTRLTLGTAILVGLLLAADDLVTRGPAYLLAALAHVKQHRPALAAAGLGSGLSKFARDAAAKAQQAGGPVPPAGQARRRPRGAEGPGPAGTLVAAEAGRRRPVVRERRPGRRRPGPRGRRPRGRRRPGPGGPGRHPAPPRRRRPWCSTPTASRPS